VGWRVRPTLGCRSARAAGIDAGSRGVTGVLLRRDRTREQREPRRGGAGPAHSVQADQRISSARPRVAHRCGCGRGTRANCRQDSRQNRFKNAPIAALEDLLALGVLICMTFREKRQQADSCDVSLTSAPTTIIRANVDRPRRPDGRGKGFALGVATNFSGAYDPEEADVKPPLSFFLCLLAAMHRL
jgi:hypothetical protein